MNDLEARLAETLRVHADAADVRPDPHFVDDLKQRSPEPGPSTVRRPVLIVAVAALIALGVVSLVAIERSDNANDPQSSTTTEAPTTTVEAPTTVAGSGQLRPEDVTDIDGFVRGLFAVLGISPTPAEREVVSRRKQALIGTCLARAGWTYFEMDSGGGPASELELSPSEFGLRFGYSAVRNFRLLPDWWPANSVSEVVDPNASYQASLGEADRAVYRLARFGEIGSQDGGCEGESNRAVNGTRLTDDPDLAQRTITLLDRQSTDRAVGTAIAAWRACMERWNPTWDVATPDAAYDSLIADLVARADRVRVEIVRGSPDSALSDGSLAWKLVTPEDAGDDTYRIVVGDPRTVPDLDGTAAREVATWIADQRCQTDAGYRDAVRDFDRRMLETLQAEFPDVQFDDPNP